jgi:hypothetical protein
MVVELVDKWRKANLGKEDLHPWGEAACSLAHVRRISRLFPHKPFGEEREEFGGFFPIPQAK